MPRPSMIPYGKQSVDSADIAGVARALKSDYLTQGPLIGQFEKALAKHLGVKHVVVLGNGTQALHLAALALGAGEKTIGFVPAVTFAASLNCLWYCGVKRVELVDVDPSTGLMDMAHLEKCLKKYPRSAHKIVIPVSLKGEVPALEKLATLAKKNGALVLEDAAHSLGATYGRKEQYKSGSCRHSKAAILSFHPVKHLSTGEGGALTTNDSTLAQKVALLRSHGIVRPMRRGEPAWVYEQQELGYNYRMTELQAALGLSQLKKQTVWLKRRRELAKAYRKAFSHPDFHGKIMLPEAQAGHAYHLFVVHFASAKIRDGAWEYLRGKGIGSQVHYVPLYRFPYQKTRLKTKALAGAENYFKGCLSIPLYPTLTDPQQQKVVGALRAFCKKL